ncbi:conjugal transfer protein TraO (plasmid) [Candidatus Fukatsuia symbiotica]|uniref:Conjugal transfer protein TraO n=1 Tax=Candidatus Fukatsuia symbiotica TaxID=1878942 RepID=A0A2U8I8I3_9GAMM|nr:conjugal transfer protein TraO [Candidatus Fukatsuia symbiotica]AWK15492.1 conjugal transfer protein TraO [Candidatus Fukatsuia symbiotica]MEA9445880.1 conjugal transfer protein TraO [Candidatus Fukatsuia symbiotica]
MPIEKELALDTSKSLILIVIGVVVLGFAIYLGYSLYNKPAEAQSNYAIDSVAANVGRHTTESAQYRELLEKYNATEAAIAREEGQSFVARIREGAIDPGEKKQPGRPPDKLNTVPPETSGERSVAADNSGLSENRRKAIDSLLQDLNGQWQPVPFQLASRIEGGEGNKGDTFTAWTASLAPKYKDAPHFAGREITDTEIVAPYTRVPGVIETAVDSDNPDSQVLATIPSSRYAGAQLHARRVQLAGDGVTIHFERMSWRGQTYTVDAYALSDDTLQSSVASDVNHRYFSRIILPAIAMGLGRTGQLFEQSSTQNMITPQGSVIQTRPATPSGSTIAGTVVGGIGNQAGQVMTSDAARLPIKQATINRGQIIAIQFIGGVYEANNVRRQTESGSQQQPSTGRAP